jgi:hypothetical protein
MRNKQLSRGGKPWLKPNSFMTGLGRFYMNVAKIIGFSILSLQIAAATHAWAGGGENLYAQASVAEGRMRACGAQNRGNEVARCVSETLSTFGQSIDKGDVARLTPRLPSIVSSASGGGSIASSLAVIGRARSLCAHLASSSSGELEKKFYNRVAVVFNTAKAVIERAR